ncbi:MAG TPA: TadE family protein [Candidatus Limnocylindria bacterium]
MRLHRRDGGSALVEFAIVAPVLLLLMIGILEAGRALNAYVTVRNAGAEGAHWAALHPGATETAIGDMVRGRITSFDASLVDVNAKMNDGTAWVSWPTDGIPESSPKPQIIPIAVEVSSTWSGVTFIGHFFPGGSGATFTSRATADAVR